MILLEYLTEKNTNEKTHSKRITNSKIIKLLNLNKVKIFKIYNLKFFSISIK